MCYVGLERRLEVTVGKRTVGFGQMEDLTDCLGQEREKKQEKILKKAT